MRRLIALLALLALPVLGPQAFAADPPGVKGLFLLTDYPAQTVRAGEVTTIRVKLQQCRPHARAAGAVASGRAGWLEDRHPGRRPAGRRGDGGSQRKREPAASRRGPQGRPARLAAGRAERQGHQLQRSSLPLTLIVGTEAPAKLSLKSRLPSLRGTPRSSFEYTLTVGNDSGKDLTVALSAQGPANFQTTFTEGFGSNEISSIPIEAGQTKDIKVKVTPPRDVKAGDYPVLVKVAAEGATAELRVTLQISGQGKAGALDQGRAALAARPRSARRATYTLVVSNDGTAPIDEVEMSGTVPANWKVEFNPKTIPSVAPNEKKDVQVLVTPSDKAIAGDYVASFRANGRGEMSSADFRITVTTSTLWGMVGIGIIAVALLVLLGAVARFGRR